jgi:hypothetical protein
MPTTWKFVDQPIASPTVLLDMNDGSTWKTLGGDFFKLPSPPLRRSVATSAMSDGGLLASASYDLRELAFTVELSATTETGRIAQLDALKAQLAKPSNLIMYQSQLASFPVFFRTLRSDEYEVDNQLVPGQTWRVSCNVLAEPFAIGIRRDLSQVTITNNPASGTNPTTWNITGIVGDSPTPAFMRISNLGAAGTAIIAQRTVNNPTALTLFQQSESATLSSDTTTWSNAAMSGGSGTASSFTSSSMATRLTYTLPTSTSPEALRGRYRVFLRVHTGGTTADFVIRYAQNPGAGQDIVYGPQVSYHAGTTWQLLDLGVIDFPALQAPQAIGYSGLPPALSQASIAIQASRANGADNLDTDFLYLVPADERLCSIYQTASTGYAVMDGPNDMTYGMAAGSSPFSGTLASRGVDNAGGLVSRYGGLPMLVPGVTNRMFMLVNNNSITSTQTVDVSYWPRWREVATS